MTTGENERLVREEFDSIWNEGTYHEERFADDYRAHGWGPEPLDLSAEQRDTAAFRRAFPDLHKEVEDVVAADDRVVVSYSMTGTHDGEFAGVEPTGREVSTTGIFIYRVEERASRRAAPPATTTAMSSPAPATVWPNSPASGCIR